MSLRWRRRRGRGGGVDWFGVGEDFALVGATGEIVDCVARDEVGDLFGFFNELGDAGVAHGLGPAAGSEALPVNDCTGAAAIELAAESPAVGVETADTLPTGAPLLPDERFPQRTRMPTTAIPVQPPAISSPNPRRLRERRPRWTPFAEYAEESSS